MEKTEQRSLAECGGAGESDGGGTSQRPATSVARRVVGSIKSGECANSNGISSVMKNESSDGAVGGGPFSTQHWQD